MYQCYGYKWCIYYQNYKKNTQMRAYLAKKELDIAKALLHPQHLNTPKSSVTALLHLQ